MKSRTPSTLLAIALAGFSTLALADDGNGQGNKPCGIPDATVARLQHQLASVAAQDNGGLFSPSPSRMWSAVVDRQGVLCSVIRLGDAWPGSRAIAIAKANTANAFSNDALALSTANLYAPTQPGGSLYGLNNSNPFNPDYLAQGSGIGRVPGGIITFGGGVPLYVGGKVIGGLGLSGDTACADHAIAYRMRAAAGFEKVPNGVGPGKTDNIIYASGTPTGFQHPHCGDSDITP
ncbi:GlcG/HbpS family heme-binding protein [Noviherbaspirillum soli]|uniref:GlcG/HbpS family heme-binding protein n=1 Tax=Noviherbaspirillum soli TaxID=1064518 RepID=UPI00188D7D0F|nr:heme-binding protein [Noviherbaspirillum soli]